ncbi:hypothetical protein V1514DRAFT_319800 [Lipomyces japonicus]|uniref:uncharacterized protein n=1 Tax=Lipomyces japonicus TaxID=56871 RepID=UPI0034CDE0C3
MPRRKDASTGSADERQSLLATSSTSSSSSATIDVNSNDILRVPGNDIGLPLLLSYERPGTILRNMTNLMLENKGPVARDHLANERNFLAWVRTSLSFATIGLAVTQAFRGYGDGLLVAGKVIGALFILLAIALVVIGAYRYYVTAIWLQRGKYPPTRAAVFNVTVASSVLIAVAFVLIVVNTSRND